MNEQKFRQESKLTDGVVRGAGRLNTFATDDSHADMSGLNHSHVIRTIADSQGNFISRSFDQFDHFGFLLRTDAAKGPNGNENERKFEMKSIIYRQQITVLHETAKSRKSC